MNTTKYTFIKTVNLIVVHVLNLALVIVNPFPIKSNNSTNDISLAPVNSSPSKRFGPTPFKAYLVHIIL